MTTFSTTRVDPLGEVGRVAIAQWLDRPLEEAVPIGGGRNNKVYRIVCEDGTAYAAKFYFQHPRDRRDRLGTEFKSLEFLWRQGIRCVPRPLGNDAHHGCALYEYVEGTSIPPAMVQDADIDAAADFLGALRELTNVPDSHTLGPASEACLSLREVSNQVAQRYDQLLSLASGGTLVRELRRFLEQDFQSVRTQLEHWSASRQAQNGSASGALLLQDQQTLSPSDFGFHNALRRADGTIVFLDFEYFGWDDPAKMVADFLLHPEMSLSDGHKWRFLSRLLRKFKSSAKLARRVEIVYPLFGLKWCLILLNEFLPDQVLRRRFASGAGYRPAEARARQLDKARKMLHQVQETYESFPDVN